MKISKELFEAVMNIKLGTYYSDNIETERRLWIDKDLICWDAVPFVGEISINDFFFKCKEWVLTQGYYLASNIYSDGACCQYFTEDSKECCECGGVKSITIHAESEQQAVFDACQWILDNKGTK